MQLPRILQRGTTAPNVPLFVEQERTCDAAGITAAVVAVAHVLDVECDIARRDGVGVFLPRGIDATIAIYAVLLRGAYYVPLDINNAPDRLRYVVDDAVCRCVIGSGERPSWLDDAATKWIDLSAIAMVEAGPLVPVPVDAEDIAALLYTSGSTGRPKGVAVSHRAIDAFCEWMGETFSIDVIDRVASLAPFHFDLSLFDLFCAPARGATVCFVPDRLTMAPTKLADWLALQQITTWYTVPSILGFLALKGGLESRQLPALRRILFAGEVFPTPRLRQLVELLPHVQFFNLFGPTETNVCLYWEVDRCVLSNDAAIPIGTEACGAEIEIDPGCGELLVRGASLMSGYWRHAGVELPVDEAGWYRTGDRVSRDADGNLRYHGRLDRMIKCGGYRIEPAEVERVIDAVEHVGRSAVVAVPDSMGGNRLVALVAGMHVERKSLKMALDANLPAYMRPSSIQLVDALPTLSNGKLDMAAIQQIAQGGRRSD